MPNHKSRLSVDSYTPDWLASYNVTDYLNASVRLEEAHDRMKGIPFR